MASRSHTHDRGLHFAPDLLARLGSGELRRGRSTTGDWLALLDRSALTRLGALLVEPTRRPLPADVEQDLARLAWALAAMETGLDVDGPQRARACGELLAALVELVATETMIRSGLCEVEGSGRLLEGEAAARYTLTEMGARFVEVVEAAERRQRAERN